MKGHGQLMALINGWNKNIGKLMVGTRNGGFAADGRPGRRTVACEFSLESFQAENYFQPTVTPAKQKTKNCEETNL